MKLIVESGATKTDWCAIDREGAVQRLQRSEEHTSELQSRI